jgi:hypothetical protein
MAIPQSFIRDGFLTPAEARKRRFLPNLKRPGIMIGTEGETNTGKTEFILSCPGPGIVLAVDRMYDAVLDNPSPPAWRRDDYVFKEYQLSMATTAENHMENWRNYYALLMTALKNSDARTVGIDGDSDTWETQRLAAFGKLSQIPAIMYTEVNAARRALISRCYDSGKIIVATNKVKDEYVTKRDDAGNIVLNKDGKEVREKSGRQLRQGFDDDNYLWHIQIRHLVKPATYNKILKRDVPMQFGLRILKCKANPGLAGTELWQDECNFAGLVSLCYPAVELKEWGL